jgi:hypothetical protein
MPAWFDAVQQDERRKKLGLDALVACYLTLRGPEGLDLIDQRFLKNPNAEYTHNYSTIMALRFHGDQETGVLPRERLLASMRLLLDSPDFAEQAVLDLSRWEDWSVLDRLVELFKSSEKRAYVRPPIIAYLTNASDQPGDVGSRAAAALTELEQFDAEGVKQARGMMTFGVLRRARTDDPEDDDPEDGNSAADDEADSEATQPDSTTADETQGFTATAADDETDPADIPDPAAYEQRDSPPTRPSEVSASASSHDTIAESPAQDAVQSAPTPSVAAPSPPQTLLVVGLPLAAAALLMGVYWLILRVGAV